MSILKHISKEIIVQNTTYKLIEFIELNPGCTVEEISDSIGLQKIYTGERLKTLIDLSIIKSESAPKNGRKRTLYHVSK